MLEPAVGAGGAAAEVAGGDVAAGAEAAGCTAGGSVVAGVGAGAYDGPSSSAKRSTTGASCGFDAVARDNRGWVCRPAGAAGGAVVVGVGLADSLMGG